MNSVSGASNNAQVDAELLAFLVKMAAFKSERLGSVGDVIVLAFKFLQNTFALEACDTSGKWPSLW